MCTQVAKWGNSLAVRIPKAAANELGLDEDTEVELTVSEGRLVLTPIRPGYRLDELLAGITEDNLHGETGTGGAVGNEAW